MKSKSIFKINAVVVNQNPPDFILNNVKNWRQKHGLDNAWLITRIVEGLKNEGIIKSLSN